MNKNPLCGNFVSGAVWHTIVFKVSAFHFFLLKTGCRDDLLDTPKFKLYNHYRYRTVVFETRTRV